jgi:hypothetical protein
VEVGFIDDARLWEVPDDVLVELVATLRTAGDGSNDPASGEPIESGRADVLADVIEMCVETDAAELGIDDRDRAAFRWALKAWARKQDKIPESVADLIETMPVP